jgi:hypothetical protein
MCCLLEQLVVLLLLLLLLHSSCHLHPVLKSMSAAIRLL